MFELARIKAAIPILTGLIAVGVLGAWVVIVAVSPSEAAAPAPSTPPQAAAAPDPAPQTPAVDPRDPEVPLSRHVQVVEIFPDVAVMVDVRTPGASYEGLLVQLDQPITDLNGSPVPFVGDAVLASTQSNEATFRRGSGNEESLPLRPRPVVARPAPAQGGAAPSYAAATPTAARISQPMAGRLDGTDAVGEDGKYGETYTFRGQAGDLFTISMRSEEIDTFLQLVGPGGFEVEDDDGLGQGTNSLLVVSLPQDGEYTLRATSYGEGEEGGYELTVEPSELPEEPVQDEGSDGALTEGDAVTPEGHYMDEYFFHGSAGETVVVTVTSEDFDTTVSVYGPGGVATSNDDAPGAGTNSAVMITLPAGGDYRVRVSSFSPEVTGTYRVRVLR